MALSLSSNDAFHTLNKQVNDAAARIASTEEDVAALEAQPAQLDLQSPPT